jgi:uncharacterized RDD family membrane protein YckC
MSSPDKLTIETPEQTALEFPLAGIGSRFLAMVADTAIQFVVGFVLVITLMFVLPAVATMAKLGAMWVIALAFIAFFLLTSAYFAFFEAVWNGQTPGKRYTNLRVMKDDGRPISPYDAITRNLLRIVDSLPALYGVGALSVILSKQSKRLGDYVAGTVVVHERAIEGERPFLETEPRAAAQAVYDVSKLNADDLQLMETFFSRRSSLEPSLRTTMADQVARRVGDKLNARVYGWPQTENFLEAVFEQYRSTGRLRQS